jgi:hypothetical protein
MELKGTSGWEGSTLATNVNVNARSTSIALDTLENPHIAYYDWTLSNLYYASQDAGGWTIDTVDDFGTTGYNPSLLIDDNDIPHISYLDISNYDLKYATYTPEPATLSLLALSGLAILKRRRRMCK